MRIDIDEIKKNIPIMDVADEFMLDLEKAGKSFKGLCPFHSEKTPSFSIKPNDDSTKDVFKCFGCGVSGNQIYLFARLNGIEYGQAIGILGKRLGLTNRKLTTEQKLIVSKRFGDKKLEKNFYKECKRLFYKLCDNRKEMRSRGKVHKTMEHFDRDLLLHRYYREIHYHEFLIDGLLETILDRIKFNEQMFYFDAAKGVLEEWEKQKLKSSVKTT